jgi:hypothetical protein
MQSRRGEGAFILTRFFRVENKVGVKESKSTFQKYKDPVIVHTESSCFVRVLNGASAAEVTAAPAMFSSSTCQNAQYGLEPAGDGGLLRLSEVEVRS